MCVCLEREKELQVIFQQYNKTFPDYRDFSTSVRVAGGGMGGPGEDDGGLGQGKPLISRMKLTHLARQFSLSAVGNVEIGVVYYV